MTNFKVNESIESISQTTDEITKKQSNAYFLSKLVKRNSVYDQKTITKQIAASFPSSI